MTFKEELKQYILDKAFDGWKDARDENVMRCIDEFFEHKIIHEIDGFDLDGIKGKLPHYPMMD